MSTEPQHTGRTPRRGVSPSVAAALVAAVLAVLLLRHDYWNWEEVGPLLFGFLPVGIWWQAMVTLLATGMMWLMVRLAWPAELEREADEGERRRLSGK